MWIFDLADGGARLLRQRSGHSQPPIKLRFHGNDGQVLLSAGLQQTHCKFDLNTHFVHFLRSKQIFKDPESGFGPGKLHGEFWKVLENKLVWLKCGCVSMRGVQTSFESSKIVFREGCTTDPTR